MKNKIERKIYTKMKKVSLSAEEKQQIKQDIFTSIFKEEDFYIQDKKTNGVRNEYSLRQSNWRLVPTFKELQPKVYKNIKTTAFSSMLVITLIGTVSAAMANDALPGDLLYPMKINVNEKVKLATALTSQERAQYQADLAVTRLQELEKLATVGILTASTTIASAKQFDSHMTQVNTFLGTMSKEGKTQEATKIHKNLNNNLKTNQAKMRIASTSMIRTRAALNNATSSATSSIMISQKNNPTLSGQIARGQQWGYTKAARKAALAAYAKSTSSEEAAHKLEELATHIDSLIIKEISGQPVASSTETKPQKLNKPHSSK